MDRFFEWAEIENKFDSCEYEMKLTEKVKIIWNITCFRAIRAYLLCLKWIFIVKFKWPISLLPVFGKVLNALINLELVHNYNVYGHLPDKQCGFHFSRFIANVLTTLNELEPLGKNGNAQALDISKAFDRLETRWPSLEAQGLWRP